MAVRRVLVVVLLLLLWAPAAQAWTWPVRGPVVQGFSFDRGHPYAAGQHRGIDIGSSGGVPVLAPSSGTVTFAGTVPGNGVCVTIETADGLAVTLTGLGSASVDRGGSVDEGARVGTVAAGASDVGGPSVHLGIRVASDPNGYLDPLSLLPPATTAGSTSSAPASSPAPAAQSSTGSAPEVGGGSPTTTVSPGTASPAASGPPATGASAPVEVPAADFAHHAVPVSSKPAPSPVARAEPTTSAAGVREPRAAVATLRPATRARAVHPGTRRRSGATATRSRVPTVTAALAATRTSVTSSFRAVDAGAEGDIVPAPRAARAPATPIAAHSARSAAPGRWLSRTAFAGGLLIALLFMLGVVTRRRRAAAVGPPHEEAVVLALPLASRPEPGREEPRLAA